MPYLFVLEDAVDERFDVRFELTSGSASRLIDVGRFGRGQAAGSNSGSDALGDLGFVSGLSQDAI